MTASTPVFRCVNCGGDNSLSLYIAVGAFVVALLSLYIAGREHREFMRQLRARADFEITLRFLSFADNVLRSDAVQVDVRLEIGLKNTGQKAASETTINVLAPTFAADLRRTGPLGSPVGEWREPVNTSELLGTSDGSALPAHWLTMLLPRMGRKGGSVCFATFTIDVPEPNAGPRLVPMRVRVSAEELPDEVEDRVAEIELRVENSRE